MKFLNFLMQSIFFLAGKTKETFKVVFILLRYWGYEIGLAEVYFQILINLQYTDANNVFQNENHFISPESPSVNIGGDKLVIELVGDFAGYTETASYVDWMLFVPKYPQHDPIVQEGSDAYMMIRRERNYLPSKCLLFLS